MAKVNLGQTRLSHVSESYTLVNQDIKVLFVWSEKKGTILKNWMCQFEKNFAESEKKMNSLENKLK